jgi:hypothetical protein
MQESRPEESGGRRAAGEGGGTPAPEEAKHDEETGWYDFLEDMLVASAEEAQGYRAMHEKAHKHYNKISTRLMIPAIILSTLTGVANFGQTTLEEIVGPRTPLYIGVLSIVAAIFSTVAKYLRADEKSETHRNAMIAWDKLHRMIATALAQPRSRRDESQEFLMRYREERNRLAEQVPIIPYKIRQWFLRHYGAQYRRLNLRKPGILALSPVTVFRGEHFDDAKAVAAAAAAAAAKLAARPSATRLGVLLQRLRSAPEPAGAAEMVSHGGPFGARDRRQGDAGPKAVADAPKGQPERRAMPARGPGAKLFQAAATQTAPFAPGRAAGPAREGLAAFALPLRGRAPSPRPAGSARQLPHTKAAPPPHRQLLHQNEGADDAGEGRIDAEKQAEARVVEQSAGQTDEAEARAAEAPDAKATETRCAVTEDEEKGEQRQHPGFKAEAEEAEGAEEAEAEEAEGAEEAEAEEAEAEEAEAEEAEAGEAA